MYFYQDAVALLYEYLFFCVVFKIMIESSESLNY